MQPIYDLSFQAFKHAPIFFALSISIFMYFGWLLGRHRIKKRGGTSVVVRESLVAAIFGLSALVLGFSFSGASNRYDVRIENMRNQANAIRDVDQSINYLHPQDRDMIKNELRNLIHLRLNVFQNLHSMDDIDVGSDKLSVQLRKITENVIKASSNAPEANRQMISEILTPQMRNLVAVFNVGSVKTKSHPPLLMVRFLYVLLCIGALLIGYTMAVKNENDWFLAVTYVVLLGFGLYVILSLEFPNLLMPYEEFNQDLLLLKATMK